MIINLTNVDDIKWAIRMPERHAVSILPKTYESHAQAILKKLVKKNLDWGKLPKDQDPLDLTMQEAAALFHKGYWIKKAKTPKEEVRAFFAEKDEIAKLLRTNYDLSLEQLQNTLEQIKQSEAEVYEALKTDENGLRAHKDTGVFDMLSVSNSCIALENLHEVERMAMTDADAAVHAKQLSELIGARAVTYQAMVDLQEMYFHDINFTNDDVYELEAMRDTYMRAYNGDILQVTGDAKIFKEQVDTIREGAMTNLEDT